MTKFIRRIDTKGDTSAGFSINIEDKKLDLEILEGNLNLNQLFKYLIKYTDVFNMRYKRKSTYQIDKVNTYIDKILQSEFKIHFTDIRNNKPSENIIITTYDNPMYLKGKYNIFIPDLLEVAVMRQYAFKNGDGYTANTKKSITDNFQVYYEEVRKRELFPCEKEEVLRFLIEYSLDVGNKNEFLEYTSELNKLKYQLLI